MRTSHSPVTVARTTPEFHRFPVHCGYVARYPRPMTSTKPASRPALEPFRLLAVAFQFLTRIPVPQIRVEDDDLRRASAAFPLVGVIVAGVGIAVRAGGGALWSSAVATVLATIAMIAVTGAFHEDGLADSVDGIWGGWSPEQRVSIMRDSRIGTYGTVALVGIIALRIALLAPVDLGLFTRAVVCGHVLGRAAGLLMATRLPALGEGTGARVAGPMGKTGIAVAVATVVAVLAVAAGVWAVVVVAGCIVPFLLCQRLFRRRLGGITGDTLGAVNQMVDVSAVAVVVALADVVAW